MDAHSRGPADRAVLLHGGPAASSDFARWLALAIFTIASMTDFFDGYLARIWDQTSNIGRMLDPIADKLVVSVVLLLLAADGSIAGWSLWAASSSCAARSWFRACANISPRWKVSVPVTWLAKWKTTIQLVAIGFLLAGPAGDKVLPYTTETGHCAAVDCGDHHDLHRL
jgi:cardiolipin synthase